LFAKGTASLGEGSLAILSILRAAILAASLLFMMSKEPRAATVVAETSFFSMPGFLDRSTSFLAAVFLALLPGFGALCGSETSA